MKCGFEVKGASSRDEVTQLAAVHAKLTHGMQSIPPDVAQKVRSFIRGRADRPTFPAPRWLISAPCLAGTSETPDTTIQGRILPKQKIGFDMMSVVADAGHRVSSPSPSIPPPALKWMQPARLDVVSGARSKHTAQGGQTVYRMGVSIGLIAAG